MELTWSPESTVLLKRALHEVSIYSAAAAERLGRAVVDACERLALFPQAGRMVPEFNLPQIREMFVGRYRLWYRLGPDGIEVLTLWPARVPVPEPSKTDL